MRRGLAVVLVALACAACSGSGDEATSGDGSGEATAQDADAAADAPLEAPVPESVPLERNTIEVYYPSIVGDGLIGEYSEIFQTATAGDQVKQIVADLISDPSGDEAMRAVPPGTRLRQAFVLDNGDCYLDFSRHLSEGMGGGSMEEMLTVYAIVDSVVLNVSQVKRVAILIEGEPIETLNGHLDLRKPLRPDLTLILAPAVVDGRSSKRDALWARTATGAAGGQN